MLAQQHRLDVIAGNAANLNTPGYLRRRTVIQGGFEDILYRVGGFALSPAGAIQNANAAVEAPCDPSPGGMRETGRALDIAAGNGLFFAVQSPQGVLYTRDGRFLIDAQGYLVTKEGYAVLGTGGTPIRATEETKILPDGTVLLPDGTTAGRLALYRLDSPVHAGNGLYSGTAVSAAGEVRQGYLVNSNADIVKEMTEAMSALRVYEVSQRTVVTSDHALGTLISSLRG